jgi:hypothetical protein
VNQRYLEAQWKFDNLWQTICDALVVVCLGSCTIIYKRIILG